MIKLLHISYDLRGRNNQPVTSAVRDLITQTEKLAHVQIVDLLRVPYFNKEKLSIEHKNHLLLNSFGLPFGIFLLYSLKRAYNKITDAENSGIIDLKGTNIIHAHKVTFEGYIAHKLALRYNSKLILTLRQTDAWIFGRRPDLLRHYKTVIESSDKIIYLMPHINKLMEKQLGKEFFSRHMKDKLEFIPNIVERNIDPGLPSPQNGYYSTALRMDKRSVKRKNIKRLFKAIKLLNDPDFKLVVIGDGSYSPQVKQWAGKMGIENNIIFKGRVPNSEMDKFYSASKAFVMPSLSESFGMVYAESLLNGTPIMYSKDAMGFDGIFENVGVGVNPFSVESIAEGIHNLIENHLAYKKHIKELQQQGDFKIFSAAHVKERYSEIINSLVN